MKKLLWSVIIIIALIIGALIVIPHFIDANKYKSTIISTVKHFTGRDLTIGGDISLSLFPDISLEVTDVAFSNIPEAKEKSMASISKLQLQIALMPLLQGGQINVKKFELIDPEIYLLNTKAGVKNWEITLPKTNKSKDEPKQATGKQTKIPTAITMIHDVGIQNGTLHYVDEQKKSSITLTKVNTTLNLSGPNDPLVLSGSADWNGVNTTTEVKVDRLQDVLSEKGSPVAVQASSELLFATYKGELSIAEKIGSSGEFEFRTSDVNGLSAWASNKPAEKVAKQSLSVKGKTLLKDKVLQISALELKLDNNGATGDLTINTATDIPFIKGNIAAGDINLEPLLADEKIKEQVASDASGASSDWSNEPIKLDGLRTVNADITLTAKSFSMPKLHLGQIDSHINLKNGRLTIALDNIGFYDGTANGTVVMDGSGATAAISNKLTLTGVNAEKLLTDTAKFKKLTGKLNGSLDVTMAGKSQKAMVSNLNGTSKFNLADGKIRGVDLISMIRNVATSFKNTGSGEQATEFSSMSGSVVITNGIAKNNDLLIKAPLLNIQGIGTADLPRKYLDYKVSPQLVGTFKGSNQAKGLQGITVPVIIRGPFSHLTYTPDVGNVLKDALQDPTKAKEQLKSLEDNLKSIGKGLKLELR